MLDDKEFEREIRGKIKGEAIYFPQDLDRKIQSVISQLPVERKDDNSRFLLNFIRAAVVMLVFITALSLFRTNIGRYEVAKNDVLFDKDTPTSEPEAVIPSNSELVEKYKAEGFIVESNPEDSSKMVGGYSMANRMQSYGSIEELAAHADIIIEGEVLAIKYFDHNKMTYTESKVRVVKSYNDKAKPGEVLDFYESGGFTTKYNQVEYSGAKEKFGDELKITPEEEEKSKKEIVFNSTLGWPVMQPGEKVVLFAVKSNFIDNKHYSTIGGCDGKLTVKNGIAERYVPRGESMSSLRMTFSELDNRLSDIIKSGITKVDVPKIKPETVNTVIFKKNYNTTTQKIVNRMEDVQKVVDLINSIEYKYSDDMSFIKSHYSLLLKGDKEYLIEVLGSRIKFNDRWYSIRGSNAARLIEEMFFKLDYKEEPIP